MESTTLTIIALIIFTIYNTCILSKFGVPHSLSQTFYLLNTIKRQLGYLFTIMLFSVAFCLMPGWIEITENITTWSNHLTAIPFLASALLGVVGAAPAFRDSDKEDKIHTISAYAAALLSIIWCAVVCYNIAWFIIPICTVVILIAAKITKTLKPCLTYWLEMIALLTTFTTILVEQL